MPYNLLLLPLLGGYLFVNFWYPTRYHALRSDGYRLLFAAAIAGSLFLLLASVITYLTLPFELIGKVRDRWAEITGVANSGVPTVAFLLGAVLWIPFNLWGRWRGRESRFSEDAAIRRAIEHKRDPLEITLRNALGSLKTVSVSTKNHKVYVGRVTRNFNPALPMESVQLLLLRSGYRDPKTREVHLTIDYEATHQTIREQAVQAYKAKAAKILETAPALTPKEIVERIAQISTDDSIEQFEIVIPVGEIQSVNFFRSDIYDTYFRKLPAAGTPPPTPVVDQNEEAGEDPSG